MATPEDERAFDRKPIRLRVSYKSAHSLVTEYTTSISRGGCSIETERPPPVGTRFTFELFTRDNAVALQVDGRVVRSEPSQSPGAHLVAIEYLPTSENRAALDMAIDTLLREHQFEKERRHLRVPVNLVAIDGRQPELQYLVKDMSTGGAGLQLAKDRPLPGYIDVHVPVIFEITLDDAVRSALEGQVVWTLAGRPGFSNPRVGISFEKLTDRQEAALQPLLRLHRPAQIVLTFGD